MPFPQAYIEYLRLFHQERDYFECHEVMEEHWKASPADPLSPAWLGLIQTAVALYHQRRDNYRGAVKMMEAALHHLTAEQLTVLGVNAPIWLDMLRDRGVYLQRQLLQPTQIDCFEDLNMPLSNELLELVRLPNVQWGLPSRMEERGIIDKHKLRDRSAVIQTRNEQLLRRRAQRLH